MPQVPVKQSLILYEGTKQADVLAPVLWPEETIKPSPPPAPPQILVGAAIQSDGTPQVGEELIGVDPQVIGRITRRRWYEAGTLLSEAQRYRSMFAATIQWIVDVIGTNGQTIRSSSTIVVVADPQIPPTLGNTLADANIPIGSVPGLLARLNALDARLVALGLAASDPDIAEAIAAALMEYAAIIEAIDLHRPLSVVLAEFEAAMSRLEEAANPQPVPSGFWHANSIDIFAGGTDWFADGTRTGGAVVIIRALLGQPSPANEGNPSTSIRAMLGQPSPALEGNPGASISAILGQPTAVNEGDPIRSLLGQPAPVAEGNS